MVPHANVYGRPYFWSTVVAGAAGFVVFLLGVTIVIGWVLDVQGLTTVLPGLVPMRPNTAAGFVLAGASLSMLTVAQASQTLQWMMRVTVALTLLLGALTLSEHIFGWNLGIDELLVRAPTDIFGTLNPGRMPSIAAAHFVLIGSIFALIDRRRYVAAQVLALVIMTIALMVLGGYLFGSTMLPTPSLPLPTAAHAALGFLLLSLGVLASSAANGFLRDIRPQLPAIGFGSTLALLSLAVAASYVDTQRMAETTSEVEETHNMRARLSGVSLAIERVVTIARVFVLTGDEEFVVPLDQTRRQITDDFTVLRQMLSGDPDQLANLASLEELTERRLALTNEYIDLRRRMSLQQTTEQISFGGEQLAVEIRTLIADMEETMQLRLEQRRTAATANHASTLAAVTFAGLVSIVLLFLAFVAFRRQTAERVELEREIIAAGEHERGRIGYDLHDSLGQELTGISLGLEVLANTLEGEHSAHVQTVRSLKALSQKSISETRRISRSLSPGFRSELGICEALSSLANEVNEHSGVNCSAYYLANDDAHDIQVATQLFRIAQEGVSNALRHGNAKNIELRYEREVDVAYLAVIDDGIGIPAEHGRVEGLGLRSMRYRARMINGTLDVAARANGGTEVRCSFKCSVAGAGLEID